MIQLKITKFPKPSQKLRSLFYTAAVLCALNIEAQAQKAQLIVLYLTDLHSHLRPDAKDGLGGYARMATLIKAEKAKARGNQDVLAIGGGDFVNKGALPCRRSQEEECVALLSKMGLDVAVFGNHELTKTAKQLNTYIAKSGIAWTSANVTGPAQAWTSDLIWKAPKSGAEFYLFSWVMPPGPKEWDSKKSQLKIDGKWGDKHWEHWMRRAAGRPVIYLPHQEIKMDLEFLARGCEKMPSPQSLVLLKGNDDVERLDQSLCAPIVEPKPYGKSIARLVFEQGGDKQWKLTKHEFVAVDSGVAEDESLKSQLDDMYARLGKDADDKALEVDQELSNHGIAKWLAETYQMVSKADLAIVNIGATKDSWPKGVVTREQLFMSIPYNNSLKGFDVSRKGLEKALCQAESRTKNPLDDWGSELILSVGELKGVGTPECRLEGIGKSQIKVVMDDFVMKNSKRWIGQDFAPVSFSFGMNTEQVLNLALARKNKK